MPDLTASLDVELARVRHVLVVPRDAIKYNGEVTTVRIQRNGSVQDQTVTVGDQNFHEAVVTAGLEEGAVIVRDVANRGGR
jgi:hypothetical protein